MILDKIIASTKNQRKEGEREFKPKRAFKGFG